MIVLRAGRRKELLARIEMDAPLYSRPAQVGDALYLATANRLYFIAANGSNQVSRAEQNMKGKVVHNERPMFDCRDLTGSSMTSIHSSRLLDREPRTCLHPWTSIDFRPPQD